jgi:hypothetical protein
MSARPDLCGGQPAMAVPTAIANYQEAGNPHQSNSDTQDSVPASF